MIWTAVFTAALWGCTGSDGKDGTIGDTGAIDGDGDGFTAADGDCDDEDALVAPGGTEVCDGIDNNCDGLVDEGVTSTFYADFDGDGFGDPSAPTDACSREDGFSAIGTDCDDDRDDVFPGAEEICDAADNNCDGLVDEGVTTAYYADADADTFGDPSTRRDACAQPDGFVLDDTDCDDARDDVSPAADEVCDEADNDCDTLIDEGVTTTYYVDIDDDAFGQSDVTTEACARPTGYADVPGDCDDANSAVNPDAVEACDTIDNDCDTLIDDEDDSRDPSLGGETFYADTDADTFGDPDAPRDACLAPDGYVADNTDCDDDAGAVNPDAGEICNDIDDDCDGLTDDEDRSVNTATGTTFYADTDTDTFGDPDAARDACDRPFGYVTDNTDCDDDTTTVNPAAAEICNDIDDDCDGLTDDEDGSTDLSTGETFYADTDADTFGDPDAPRDACLAPDGYVADNTDCDDDAGAVNPDAGEICNDIDDDCDGLTDDEDNSVDRTTGEFFYEDDDGDGYGDLADPQEACTQPDGFVSNSADCDDAKTAINPDADEVCDNVDNDCDALIDDDDGDLDTRTGETFYRDDDGDGYGVSGATLQACEEPDGYASVAGDCDDDTDLSKPGGTEICDGEDNDCDDRADEGVIGVGTGCPAESCQEIIDLGADDGDGDYYVDTDGDGAGELTDCDMTTDGGGWTRIVYWNRVDDGDDLADFESLMTENFNNMSVWRDRTGYIEWADCPGSGCVSADALDYTIDIDVPNEGEVMFSLRYYGFSMEDSAFWYWVEADGTDRNLQCARLRSGAGSRYTTAERALRPGYTCAEVAGSGETYNINFSKSRYDFSSDGEVTSFNITSLHYDSFGDYSRLYRFAVWVR